MNSKFFLAALLVATLFAACQTDSFFKKDEGPDGGIKWDSIDFRMEPYVQGLLATPFELYVISENSFARLSADLDVVERRPFLLPSKSNSLPALSENTLARLTTNAQGRQVVEFHLARNSTQVFSLLVDTLPVVAGNSLEIESFNTPVGAFSNDGSLFLMPAKLLPARTYSLYLFEIRQNFQHNAFESLKMIKRIDLPDLSADADEVIKAVKFLNGNFYLTTQQGAWRITPSGVIAKVRPSWKEDCFAYQGDLYMTGIYDYDLDKSIDNGLEWERVNVGTEMRHVVVADTMLFTQQVPGQIFRVMPKDFKLAKEITYPTVANPVSSAFYGLVFFEGRYIFSMDKWLFATEKVVVD
jgi:hypothetical protein